ncbi:tyrosine-protein kinase family protein [Paenibacillus ginsengarvi]|uniref:AAA domain-containing protein n=1 Tax=Paenibacillus ginsengarvi TaxID=400777 RepID=A0A3B0BTL8_9BACL|nr:AAA family ATPase [Paenibacillus ginsengarvi]RKN74976.1 hypothetical protein D7M11_25900 [Paenibacillus ginsengarvi]
MEQSIKDMLNILKESFIRNNEIEWVELSVNSLNLINVLIVSNIFENMSYEDKHKKLIEKIQFVYPYYEGYIELLTVDEAYQSGIQKPVTDDKTDDKSDKLRSWGELSSSLKNEQKINQLNDVQFDVGNPKIISFYSYKGGVGRTAALIHVAYILASRGKKVVIIDMDIEAPGMSNVFDPKVFQAPKFGVIDYLFERLTKVDGMENEVSITDIFSEVSFKDISGRLFFVPAGNINVDYLSKVDSFRAESIVNSNANYWEEFIEDLNNQVKPDIILIDSRTGINGWGALSVLNLSDKVIFFVYPNTENVNGTKVLLSAMKEVGYKNYNIVFSRIHDDKSGKKKVDELWGQIKNTIFDEEELSDFTEDELSLSEPLKVFYSSELAVADYYPVPTIYHIYSPIANLIDEEIKDSGLVSILAGTDRWRIVKSLPYENLGFGEIDEDPTFFQKTVYLDKFLDEDVSVITGKKGTGKTKLYSMMLKHLDKVKSMTRIDLDNTVSISGHGDFSIRPINEFDEWAKMVNLGKASWENIWMAYLLVVLQKNNQLNNLRNGKFSNLKTLLKPAQKDTMGWKFEYTNIINEIIANPMHLQLVQDFINELDLILQKRNEKIWIHYDKLDEDLERKVYGKEAVEGLFKLIQIIDGRHIKNIKFKVFIRQDIWESLGFTNKSHFKGKTIKLEWNQQDFLKLALKISLGSDEFKQIVIKYKSIPHDIDYMDIDSLKESLQILWGIRRDGTRSQYVVNWIYERLTDAESNTFPRSLFMLLKGAQDQELTYEHSSNKLPPRDRLLRSASLNIGLKEASIERCDALKQEYVKLKGAFELFERFTDTFSYSEFDAVYRSTEWDTKDLLDILKKIGVISEKEDGNYKFAYIYLDGFKIKRTSKI